MNRRELFATIAGAGAAACLKPSPPIPMEEWKVEIIWAPPITATTLKPGMIVDFGINETVAFLNVPADSH